MESRTWNIAHDGTPAAVIDYLSKNKHLPQPVTDMVVQALQSFNGNQHVMLDTNGRIDNGKGEGTVFLKLSIFNQGE